MVSWSGVVFLAFLGIIVTASGLPRQRTSLAYKCPNVYKPCNGDLECNCVSTRLICNLKKVCNEISIMDIIARQRCPKMFKRECGDDRDCRGCPGLMCEDRECVHRKITMS